MGIKNFFETEEYHRPRMLTKLLVLIQVSIDVEEEKEEGVKKVSSLFVSAVSFRGNGIR